MIKIDQKRTRPAGETTGTEERPTQRMRGRSSPRDRGAHWERFPPVPCLGWRRAPPARAGTARL